MRHNAHLYKSNRRKTLTKISRLGENETGERRKEREGGRALKAVKRRAWSGKELESLEKKKKRNNDNHNL